MAMPNQMTDWTVAVLFMVAPHAGVLALGAQPHATHPVRLVVHEAAAARPAAAFPPIIIVAGPPLEKRVILRNDRESLRLLSGNAVSQTERTTESLSGRPYLELWLFWEPHWRAIQNNDSAIARLDRKDATQHGRFYPSDGRNQALMLFYGTLRSSQSLRLVTTEGLEILRRHGVPIRLNRERRRGGALRR